ncbi:class II glutamine amidotransferase, partial [Ruminococcus callidus]|uniref:class II glutamine amidotransferase n=1 Tax=Ruminococcus callidus TaxID=40519 RepID=UPI003C6DE3DF
MFGFLDYKGKVSNAVLKKLIHYLSVSAEVRGTDATGIAYVRDGSIVTYKKPKPAHKVKLFFPRGTRSVIGHTRFTTQGSEKRNCNNHPFEGHCGTESFTLAHNGVLYNDRELRREQHLPPTPIETDSYIAVQLLEQGQQLDTENIKRMAELVEGSFVFTILRNDNTLFLVKGNNPLALYHFPALGLYVYASTKSILDNALKKVKLNGKCCEVDVSEGEILEINSAGNLSRSTFTMQDYIHTIFNPYNWNQLDYA